MHPLIEQLVTQGPVLTDGAWGTELQARGLDAGECPDQWNLTQPQRVKEVARAYVEAGSQIILTNTFRANRVAMASHGLAERVREINLRGVEISRGAAAGRAHVFASMGPSGKLLMTGEVSEDELLEAYTEQARALADGGADALVVETMSDLTEAKLGLQAARATGLPVVVSMAFDSGKNFDRTMMGTTAQEAAAELTAAGADVIGANCGQPVERYLAICLALQASTTLPIWLKPNAGLPVMEDGRTLYRTTPDHFAAAAAALHAEFKPAFVGGCCGTDPRFIRALELALEEVRNAAGAECGRLG